MAVLLYIIYGACLAVIIGTIYLIFKWVNKFIFFKQEQNDLLREIIKK